MIDSTIFAVYTGNRFNQVLLFDSYEKAEKWLKESTRYTDSEIAKAIKIPRWNGQDFISIFE